MPKPSRNETESDATPAPVPPAPDQKLPRRSTMKSRKSRFSLFGSKSRNSARFDTASVISREGHAFAPCKLCRIDLTKGVKIFAVIHLIYCVVVLILHFVELFAALEVIDVHFQFMNPDKKLDSSLLSSDQATNSTQDFERPWVPSLVCCVTDSLQLIAAFFIIPATFKGSEKYCAIWLVATYLLYFPHMFYFGFAIAIGTSWISLILQLIDSLLYTPYAIWIIRSYMETLEIEKELATDPPPLPLLPPPPPPQTSSAVSSLPSPRHTHVEVLLEHKKGTKHPNESASQRSESITSGSEHHHPHHEHEHDHEHKTPKKSVLKKPGSHFHPHHPPKTGKQKGDTMDEMGKRLWE
ncbi:unnamed protein product [Orchesella dallaii]|uniref:Uncharacterized protein n=1 Tax=Orchesella dallaii TaxID=48710 RepID=A0ABP1PWQ8_9HEXA